MSVEIFGMGNCVNCSKAIKVAKSYNLPYEYFDITYKKFRDILEDRVEIEDGTPQPIIFWNNRCIGTYDDFLQEIEDTMGGFGDGRI